MNCCISRQWLVIASLPISSFALGNVNPEVSPPIFVPLPTLPGNEYCVPYAISADGSTIVGECPFPNVIQAFRYTATGGIVGLGWAPGSYGSIARAVSADGSVIVGWSLHYNPQAHRAFRWTKATGLLELPHLPNAVHSVAEGVSGDGNIVVGTSGSDANNTVAFRWTETAGMVSLGSLPPNPPSTSRAQGITTSGNFIVGYSDQLEDSQRPCRWNANGGIMALGVTSGTPQSAYAISGNGMVMVGTHRWTAPNYFPQSLPGFQLAFSVSDDGSIIVGRGWSAGGGNYVARIWTQPCGTRDLRDLLLVAGITSLADWQLNISYDIADDNRTIVGLGTDPLGKPAGFMARLPRVGDLNFDGMVNVVDLLLLINSWGPCAPGACTFADVNCDGALDKVDLLALIDNWG